MKTGKQTILCILLVNLLFLKAVAQQTRFKDVIEAAASPETDFQQIKALKVADKNQEFEAELNLLSGFAWTKAMENSPVPVSSLRLADMADSAAWCFSYSKLLSEKDFNRKEKFYTAALASRASMANADFEQYSEITAQQMQLALNRKFALQQLTAYQTATIQAYQTTLDYMARLKTSFEHEYYLLSLSEDRYRHAADSLKLLYGEVEEAAARYQQALAAIDLPVKALKISFTHSNNVFDNVLSGAVSADDSLLQVVNLNHWLQELEKNRINRLFPVIGQLEKRWNQIGTTAKQAGNSEPQPLPEVVSAFDPDGYLARLAALEHALAKLENAFEQESEFLQYTADRTEIISYYYQLQARATAALQQLGILKEATLKGRILPMEAFIARNYNGLKGYRKYLQNTHSYLRQKENYCNIKLKDQLVAAQLQARYLPVYARFKDEVLPLYEQPVGMAVEYGQFVTTRIASAGGNELYITGYQKNQVKEPFVALVKGLEVIWLQKIEMSATSGNSWGSLLSTTLTGCLLTLEQYNEAGILAARVLLDYDHKGNMLHQIPLQLENQLLGTQKTIEGNYLLAFTKPFVKDKTFIEMRTGGNRLLTESSFSATGYNVQMTASGKHIVLLCNVTNLADSHGFPVEVNSDSQQTRSNLLMASFGSSGQLQAMQLFRSDKSHFYAHVQALDDQQLLVLGFKGSYDFNNIQDCPLMYLTASTDLQQISGNIDFVSATKNM